MTELTARLAAPADRELLRQFTCANGTPASERCDRFIQEDALDRAAVGANDFRLLLIERGSDLVAVVVHVQNWRWEDDVTEEPLPGTEVMLLALATTAQGGREQDGMPTVERVIQLTLADVVERDRASGIGVMIEAGNDPALRLARRLGDPIEYMHSGGYVALWFTL